MKKKILLKTIKEILSLLPAALCFAAGYDLFLLPLGLQTGGAAGCAAILTRLFPTLPTGVYLLLINLPLLGACFFVYGKPFLFRTAIGVALTSAALDLFSFLPAATQEPLLGALLGGGLVGASLGLFYANGFNTGGGDLAVLLLQRKLPSISKGALLFVLDGAVVLLSGVVAHDLSLLFISALAVAAQTIAIDFVQAGFDRGRLALIFTDKPEKVALRIREELSRGVTLFPVIGGYSGKESRALLCAVRKEETGRLRALLREEDEHAFSVYADASLIEGLGFEKKGW